MTIKCLRGSKRSIYTNLLGKVFFIIRCEKWDSYVSVWLIGVAALRERLVAIGLWLLWDTAVRLGLLRNIDT